MNAGLLEGAAVPLTGVVAEPLEHPFMGPVRARDKTVERHDHLENDFSIAHCCSDRPDRLNSSLSGRYSVGGCRTTQNDGTPAFAGVRECPRQESNLEPSD